MIKESPDQMAVREIQEMEDKYILESFSFCEICGAITKNSNIIIDHSKEQCNANITKEVVES
jgi:hypothetical protein